MRSARSILLGISYGVCCALLMGQAGPCSPPSNDDEIVEPDDSGDDDANANTPSTLAGKVTVTHLKIPAGQTTLVKSDVEIDATGDVTIDGQLVADTSPADGYSITINAGGDVRITGIIQAGDGAQNIRQSIAADGVGSSSIDDNGYNGGTVCIHAGGELMVEYGVVIQAGNGSAGVSGTRGGMGGKGGDVILCAGEKLVMRGGLHVGNGGDGGDADTTSEQSPSQFNNGGGDSGFLYVGAGEYEWDGLDTDRMVLEPSATIAPVTGGAGGGAGWVNIIDDMVTCSVFATSSAARHILHAQATAEEGTIVGTMYRVRKAANGGQGWMTGGAGGSILLEPCAREGPDGLNWEGHAGHGGSVKRRSKTIVGCQLSGVVLHFAVGGGGGLATITATGGALGEQSRPEGGKGGSVVAVGGNGGDGEFIGDHFGGWGGRALAAAGFGGGGYSRSCEDQGGGGTGGDGGDGEATGGDGGAAVNPGKGGQGLAQGAEEGDVAASGGSGGDGVGGAGGQGGLGGTLKMTDGADGAATPNAIIGTVTRTRRGHDGEPGESESAEGCQ